MLDSKSYLNNTHAPHRRVPVSFTTTDSVILLSDICYLELTRDQFIRSNTETLQNSSERY